MRGIGKHESDSAHDKVYYYGIMIVIYECMTEIESDYYIMFAIIGKFMMIVKALMKSKTVCCAKTDCDNLDDRT